MTTYNTGNPIGSKDPRDLYDNAENLDVAVNDDAATWVDRLGVQRSTLWQMLEYSKQFNDRGDWQTSTAYARKDYFTYNGVTYVTLTAHTSTSVAADLAAGKIGVMSGNSGAMDFLQAGTGAVTRSVESKLRDVVSILDFNANNQGADAAANDAAFAAVVANTNIHSVFLPAGTYLISQPILINRPLSIIGESTLGTSINANVPMEAVIKFNATGTLARLRFRDFTIRGTNNATNGIYCPSTGTGGQRLAHSHFDSIRIRDTVTAINIENCYSFALYNIEAFENTNGLKMLVDGGQVNIINCAFYRGSGYGAYIYGAYGLVIAGCVFESMRQAGLILQFCQGIILDAVYFESNCTDGYTYTNPAMTIKADIHMNGSTAGGFPAGSRPTEIGIYGQISGATINANSFTISETGYQSAFFAGGYWGGVSVNNCRIASISSLDSVVMVPFDYNSFGLIDVEIVNNYYPNIVPANEIKFYGTPNTFWSNNVDSLLVKPNTGFLLPILGDNPSAWQVVAYSANSAAFTKTAGYYKGWPIWTLTAAGTSMSYGVSVNAADFPDLIGKYVAASCYFKLAVPGSQNVDLYFGRKSEGGVHFSSNAAWQLRTVFVEWPSSGTVELGISLFGAGPSIDFAGFIAYKVGIPYHTLLATAPRY